MAKSIINPDWSWKQEEKKSKKIKKHLTKHQRKKIKKNHKKQLAFDALPKDFYKSEEWRKLRYKVLRKYSAECMCCGRSKKYHGIVIHVDHVKPRSKYPHLALDFKNLQILCEDCNLGKSNIDETDWRQEEEYGELELVYEAMKHI